MDQCSERKDAIARAQTKVDDESCRLKAQGSLSELIRHKTRGSVLILGPKLARSGLRNEWLMVEER